MESLGRQAGVGDGVCLDAHVAWLAAEYPLIQDQQVQPTADGSALVKAQLPVPPGVALRRRSRPELRKATRAELKEEDAAKYRRPGDVRGGRRSAAARPKDHRVAPAQFSRDRLGELTTRFELGVAGRRSTDADIDGIVRNRSLYYRRVLDVLKREEFQAACEAFEKRLGDLFMLMSPMAPARPRAVPFFNGGLFTNPVTLPLHLANRSQSGPRAPEGMRTLGRGCTDVVGMSAVRSFAPASAP